MRALALLVVFSPLQAGCAQGCTIGSQQGYAPEQPIAFSHALHAGDLRVDCLYCHSGAEESRHAGVPAVQVCMNCHSQVKKDSPALRPLVRAIDTGEPIRWTKVHRLPDHAYFNHASHVRQGVACQSCHGPVEQMVRVEQTEPMTMGWCLDCHRASAGQTGSIGPLAPPTDCSGCHY
jgi:hypothetical protein